MNEKKGRNERRTRRADMGIIPILFLSRGSGGALGRRCRKCGEPITLAGRFEDDHPILSTLATMLLVLVVLIVCMTPPVEFLSWTTARQYDAKGMTFVAYVKRDLHGVGECMKDLW